MNDKIVILDYKMGNLNSVKKKFDRLGANVIISSKKEDVLSAGKLILPGVGHFGIAMDSLRDLDLIKPLNEAVLINKTPVLGICLGMQIMTKRSDEGDVEGLGWLDAEVVKFKVSDSLKFKVPHTGWNQVENLKISKLMMNVPDKSEFYFVHSYHVKLGDSLLGLNSTEYETPFTSAFEKGNIYGVQYHPEKSHDVGTLLLENFMKL
ncbi:imidazole glycerol phosphate synthase subunit HisH [Vicingaceae bacterium]|nr:imidazole glycerol phosphate synthase subunit HisH [Vicingaceae bacterium]